MRLNLYIKDTQIIEFLKQQQNMSKYICGLVQRDMINNYPLTKEEILRIIQENTKNGGDLDKKLSISERFD